MSITLVCDDCGNTLENATWGLPEGWTGPALGAVNPSRSVVKGHRCDECHKALTAALDEALDARHELRESRRQTRGTR